MRCILDRTPGDHNLIIQVFGKNSPNLPDFRTIGHGSDPRPFVQTIIIRGSEQTIATIAEKLTDGRAAMHLYDAAGVKAVGDALWHRGEISGQGVVSRDIEGNPLPLRQNFSKWAEGRKAPAFGLFTDEPTPSGPRRWRESAIPVTPEMVRRRETPNAKPMFGDQGRSREQPGKTNYAEL
jgi:hypothetical protein